MSRMSELDSLLVDAEEHAKALLTCMSELRSFLSTSEGPPGNQGDEPPKAPKEKPPSAEEVRAYLANLSRAGHTKEIRAILTSRGYNKLSEVPDTEYPAIMDDARALE